MNATIRYRDGYLGCVYGLICADRWAEALVASRVREGASAARAVLSTGEVIEAGEPDPDLDNATIAGVEYHASASKTDLHRSMA